MVVPCDHTLSEEVITTMGNQDEPQGGLRGLNPNTCLKAAPETTTADEAWWLADRSDQHPGRHHPLSHDPTVTDLEQPGTSTATPLATCLQCKRTFLAGEDVREGGQHYCTYSVYLHSPPLQDGGDRSPENLET